MSEIGNNSTKFFQSMFKSLLVHFHLRLQLHAIHQVISLRGFTGILFTKSEKMEINMRVRYFFIDIPHITFQDPCISGSRVSQLRKSVTDGLKYGRTDRQAQTTTAPSQHSLLLRFWIVSLLRLVGLIRGPTH